MNQALKAAAYQVAELEAAANIAADVLAAAHGRADDIRDRRTTLTAERDAMATARRAGGEINSARLAVIQLDIEAIDTVLVAAGSAVAAAQANADAARIAADGARQHLDLVKQTDLLAKLKPHADELVQKLAATMAEIKSAESI